MFKRSVLVMSAMQHVLGSRINSNLSATKPCHHILKEVIKFKDTEISNWIIEKKVVEFCLNYQNSTEEDKQSLIKILTKDYSIDQTNITRLVKKISSNENCDRNWLLARERDLKNALVPSYHWLFMMMGRLENGVKFLVDFRVDVLQLLSTTIDIDEVTLLQQLNYELKDLFLLWFSVGFLHIERITWQSSCDILEKVSNYEQIHPIENWVDLKRRVGPYRRCYVFTHPSMPREPLVVLHVALCDVISESVEGIEKAEQRIIGNTEKPVSFLQEDKSKIKAAIFYSVASTQKGLQGIELSNYLIKQAASLVKNEFPLISQFSTLSPVPNFRPWLLEKLKADPRKIFSEAEEKRLKEVGQITDLFCDLKQLFSSPSWMENETLVQILREPLMRSCAWYLYREKRRNYALNLVANFHLRNGAVMWRINWMADTSKRGADNSCGIMVNYRYYLDDAESNSRNYIEGKVIKASDTVLDLVEKADELIREK